MSSSYSSQDFSSPMSRDNNVTRDTVTRRDSHESVNRRASYASNRDKQVRLFTSKFSRKSFRHFPKKSILSTDMNPLTTTAKTTLIYLSALTGVNLVLITSSDPTTVVVGYACLILSISSLASFILDQAMLE